MRRSGVWVALPAFALALLAGGCWDYRDINDRSLSLGAAVDAAPGGGHAVTLEIASLASTTGGGGQGGSTPEGRAVIRAAAGTSSHAMGRERVRWNRPLEFGHQTVWIMGETYARRGEKDEFGCAGCHPAMSVGQHFLVAEGRGADFLNAPPPEGTFASTYLESLIGNAETRGAIPHVNQVAGFVADMEENRVALAPRLGWEEGRPRLAGAAVFRDYRLIGWLDEDETLGVSFLQGHGRRTTLEIPCPPFDVGGTPAARDTAVNITHRSAALRAEEGPDGRVVLRYRIRAEAIAFDAGCPRAAGRRGLGDVEEKALAREAGRAIHRRATAAIRRAQAMGADFLSWEPYLRRAHPALWRDLRPRWDEEMRRLPVDVRVEVRVRRQSRLH